MAAIMDVNAVRLALRSLTAVRNSHLVSFCKNRSISVSACSCQRNQDEKHLQEVKDEFRTFEIPGLKARQAKKRFQRRKKDVLPPRFKKMQPDQDWTSVWPAASTFKWSVVPLPVRQGMAEKTTENEGITPGKYANAELMKPPNFLHLTPNHIKNQCQAIKKFCTEWPTSLRRDRTIYKHFPVTVTTADYCFSSPTVRDSRARKVTVKLSLSALELDDHALDKLRRLVGRRYNPKTGLLTITTDRCPVRKQNYDYALYLLTAVYFESWKKEAWEDDKTEADMEKYRWIDSPSYRSVVSLLHRIKETEKESSKSTKTYLPDDLTEEKVVDLDPVREYKEAVSEVINEGENYDSLLRYKNSVKKMLNMKT